MKHAMLTYIKPTDESIDYSVVWEAMCDCGNPCKLVPRTRKSCGCLSQTEASIPKDWTGQKLHSLTFIKVHEKRKRSIMWEAVCDCGNTCYVLPSNVQSGRIKGCGCKRRYNTNSRIYTPIESSARVVWYRYKDGCDFDTFYRLSQLPCDYCGVLPYKTYNRDTECRPMSDIQRMNGIFTYNGLDRIDSSKTHTPDNIVPCCMPCNYMKQRMGVEDFLSHIARIYLHNVKRMPQVPSPQ